MNIFSSLLCRILPVPWEQPLLTSNSGNPNFHVWCWYENAGGSDGNGAWWAVADRSGWHGRYITCYANENWNALNLGMWTSVPTLVTGISYYVPTINSDMDWGSVSSTQFYGSNDNSNWTQLYSTGHVDQDRQLTFSFTNSNYYQYYRFRMTAYGGGHRDRLALCSFNLNAVYEDFA